MGTPRSWTTEDQEVLRQAQVYASGILGRPADPVCLEIVERAAARFDVPIAMISILDDQRQFYPARVGIAIDETPRNLCFCERAGAFDQEALYIIDTTGDPRFADSPFVTDAPFVRFYGGAPLLVESGEALGTLCVIDTAPRAAFAADDHADFLALAAEALAAIDLIEARIDHGGEAIERLVGQIRSAAAAGKDALVTALDRILRDVEAALRLAGA